MSAFNAFRKTEWVVIDMETTDPAEDSIQSAIAAYKPPSNIKDIDKIAEHKRTAAKKIRDKAALLDSSPIICVALKTDFCGIILNGMSLDAISVENWAVIQCGSEKNLLIALKAFLDAVVAEDTVIVCHNANYDLPKARNGFLRHRLRLPDALADPDQPVFDTMKVIRRFSMELADERFVSLDTVARVLGIPQPKQVINGQDCPRLHKEGQYAAICTYCCIDVETTTRAYLLMSGQSSELQ